MLIRKEKEEEYNVDKLLSKIAIKLDKEDNIEYLILGFINFLEEELQGIYCKEIRIRRNLFCLELNYSTAHQNSGKP